MVFEDIEKLKHDYTDKYVVVDEQRPELRRFRGLTGLVKTVNMSGRALVQFDGRNNVGWYDIAPEFLTIVPPPPPKEETKPGKKKEPAAAKTPVASAESERKTPDKPVPAEGVSLAGDERKSG
jgi:hypothetical protein